MLSGVFVLAYTPAGAIFNTYTPGFVEINGITMIGGILVNDASNQGLLDIIEENNLTDDLVLGSNGNSLSLTRVIVDERSYYVTIDNLKEQLEGDKGLIAMYEDLPALNAGLRGAIIEINGNKIETYDDLSKVMVNYGPGGEINIKTKYEGEVLEYDLILGEDPNGAGRGVLGIGVIDSQTRLIGKVAEFFNFFKKPATNYEPKLNSDFIIFIYNLIWWIALVNLSVALVNMLPMGIFDGGRMFMLTMWGISGSEKFGKIMYKIATYLILGVLFLLMFGWFSAMF
jgi:hypothetical protein